MTPDEKVELLREVAQRLCRPHGDRFAIDELVNEAWAVPRVHDVDSPVNLCAVGKREMQSYIRSQTHWKRTRRLVFCSLEPMNTEGHRFSIEPVVEWFDLVEFRDWVSWLTQGLNWEHRVLIDGLAAGVLRKDIGVGLGLNEPAISLRWSRLRKRLQKRLGRYER